MNLPFLVGIVTNSNLNLTLSVAQRMPKLKNKAGTGRRPCAGNLPGQDAFSGVLNLLYDLGLTLVSVETLDEPASVEG